MNQPLPPEAARRWGRLQHLAQRGADEWSAECPKCGDLGHKGRGHPDRFRIFTADKPRAWCRQCGFFEFADSDLPGRKPTREELDRFRKERLVEEVRRLEQARAAIALLQNEHAWERYHADMPDLAREWWHAQGIFDWAIDWLGLGYCASRTVWSGGKEHVTATYTIPVFHRGRKVQNIRHRLANPPKPGDKYRPHRAGLPLSLYLTDPESVLHETAVLCEGEKKAIVAMQCADFPDWTIVGVPGSTPPDYCVAPLRRAGRVVVILDPGADPYALARRLGNARVVELPCKLDDAITAGAIDRDTFRRMVETAAPISQQPKGDRRERARNKSKVGEALPGLKGARHEDARELLTDGGAGAGPVGDQRAEPGDAEPACPACSDGAGRAGDGSFGARIRDAFAPPVRHAQSADWGDQ